MQKGTYQELDQRDEEATVHWMQWGALLLLLMVLAFPAYRLQEPSARAHAAERRVASLTEQGDKLFAQNCSSCHGNQGMGGVAPALNSQQFLGMVTDDQIAGFVAVGVPGTAMSAYSFDFGGPMTLEQIEAISVYLRSLEKDAPDLPNWRDPVGAAGPTTTLPEGGDPAAEGRAVYGGAGCGGCHGADLSGGVGPALGEGTNASALSDDELIAVITNGRDAMPSFQNRLTFDDISVLIAFLRQAQAG